MAETTVYGFLKKNYWKIALGAYAFRGFSNTNPVITAVVVIAGLAIESQKKEEVKT